MGTNVLDSLSIPDFKDSSRNVECTFQSGSGFSPKKTFQIQLVLNIFKSQRGFCFQNFTSEYLSHKFKSPLLWNILEREEHWAWWILHFGYIYSVQPEFQRTKAAPQYDIARWNISNVGISILQYIWTKIYCGTCI